MPQETVSEPPVPVLVGNPPRREVDAVGGPGLGQIVLAIVSGNLGLATAAGAASTPPALPGVAFLLAVALWAAPVLIWLSLILRHAAALRRGNGDAGRNLIFRFSFFVRLFAGGSFVIGGALFTLVAAVSALLRS